MKSNIGIVFGVIGRSHPLSPFALVPDRITPVKAPGGFPAPHDPARPGGHQTCAGDLAVAPLMVAPAAAWPHARPEPTRECIHARPTGTIDPG